MDFTFWSREKVSYPGDRVQFARVRGRKNPKVTVAIRVSRVPRRGE